jgi:translation elongation factor EF-1alpha
VLIVSATTGDYEDSIPENIQLLNSVNRLGIKQLIVCVDNMEGTEPTFSEVTINFSSHQYMLEFVLKF